MEIKSSFKQTAVGNIPDDWDVKPFAKLFEFRNGVNADKAAYGQGVPFINVLEPITYSHIYGPEITGKVSLTESVIASYSVQRGDVLFNRTSETQDEVGLAATYIGTERVVFGGFVIRARPTNKSLDPIYSGYALRAPIVRSQIIPMGQGAIRANISQQNLRQVVIPVPPISEQHAIATKLSDVDALLDVLDRLIVKKSDLKQAAMQQLLTGQTRLPGFHVEWETVLARDIGEFKGGSGFPLIAQGEKEGDYPFFKVSDMNNKGNETFMTTANHYISKHTRKRLGATVFPSDSIVFAKVGAAVFLERKKLLGQASCIDNNMAAFVLNKSRVDVGYVHALLLNMKLGDLVATTALPALNAKQLGEMPLSIPSLPEQRAIAAVLSDMDVEFSALEGRRNKTRVIKQAMMQELLTGRIRIV